MVRKIARGKFVENMQGELVNSRFVAAEVARDVSCDVCAGTPALKALRMILSLAATRDGKRRVRSVALCDIVAKSVRAQLQSTRLWQYWHQMACWRDECVHLLMALDDARKASKRWQQYCASFRDSDGARAR